MTQEEKELQEQVDNFFKKRRYVDPPDPEDKRSFLKWFALVIAVIAVDILIHSLNNY